MSLDGHETLKDECDIVINAYKFERFSCIITYCMSTLFPNMESTNCMIIITVTIVDASYHVKCTKLAKQLWQYFPIMQVAKD